MKTRNYHYRGTVATVNRLLDEYTFIGRDAEILEPGHIVVYALPRPVKKKEEEERPKRERGSRKNTYRSSK
jgi:hypothetical protein